MDYDVDIAIVGGGLSGISAAITAARNGLSVIVLERGEYSGSKNVSGGRMYVHSLKRLVGDRFKDAPLELPIKKETFEVYNNGRKTTFSFESEENDNSYSVLRSKFDRWLASEAENNGVAISYSTLVTDVRRENGIMVVESNRGDIRTPLVIESDGASSFVSRYLGLSDMDMNYKMENVKNLLNSDNFPAKNFMLGIKEIVERKAEDNTGEAKTILGLTDNIKGGGFVYTNKNSYSIGLTLKIDSLESNNIKSHEIIEKYRENLGMDGKILEYSAHLIPFYRYDYLPKRYDNNLLVTGDAAGFMLNDGFTIRGMDLAIESGMIAGNAAKKITDSKDYSDTYIYEKMLEDSFVLKDLKTASRISSLFGNERTFNVYPSIISNLIDTMFTVTDNPRENIKNVIMNEIKNSNISYFTVINDLLKVI